MTNSSLTPKKGINFHFPSGLAINNEIDWLTSEMEYDHSFLIILGSGFFNALSKTRSSGLF